MSPSLLRSAAKTCLCGILFCPYAVLSQSTAFNKLVITSSPSGANISINGGPRPETTPQTYVVGPGKYTVSVTSGPNKLNCQFQPVTAASGNTFTFNCTASGQQQKGP
jgi:hypothetical protein